MAMTPEAYEGQIQALLPKGPAWPWVAGSESKELASGWAYVLARIEAAVMNLIEEADPRTAYDLFTDWERVAGLPDACDLAFGGDQELGQRREALLARLTSVGGQTVAYYISVAKAMGYDITITEYHEHTVDDDVDHALNSADWNFAWSVNVATEVTVFDITVDDTVDDPIAYWGYAILECAFDRIKPAHTYLLFTYGEED